MQRANAFDAISRNKQVFEERVKNFTERNEFARQATRTWREGDVYAPKDLSPAEMIKWKQPKKPTKDILDMVGINPLDHYKVCSCARILLRFMVFMVEPLKSEQLGRQSSFDDALAPKFSSI